MKHFEKLFYVLTLTVLSHYFVLNFFQVETVQNLTGKVEEINSSDKGIFPRAQIKFVIENNDNGDKKLITKTISLIKNDINKFKIGKVYSIKTQKDWFISLR